MNQNKTSTGLGQYVRNVFDLNRDGKVTFKEMLHTLIPNQAVALALIVVDILAALGEIRVWEVAMTITQGNQYTAAGFVAVSLVPFYLSQLLWLYPRATNWQQGIAVVMMLTALVTSANFGLADLTQTYNVVAISRAVVYLWLLYIVLLLVYVLIDRNFRLHRTKITAQANAAFQQDMNKTTADILSSLRLSLEEEQKLREQYGDEAVEAHLALLRARGVNNAPQQAQQAPALPSPAPAPAPVPPAPPALPMGYFCPNCGTKNPIDNVFCTSCGTLSPLQNGRTANPTNQPHQ
jgi:hypothetical protein